MTKPEHHLHLHEHLNVVQGRLPSNPDERLSADKSNMLVYDNQSRSNGSDGAMREFSKRLASNPPLMSQGSGSDGRQVTLSDRGN